MKVICFQCNTHIRDVPSEVFDENTVSHGLCKTCAHHFIAQTGIPLEEYLEGIDMPVVTVTPEGTIGTANTKTYAFLGKSPAEIQGAKGGDVFECQYALLPEGCGQTIHCSGCAIRRTVMDTMETGNTHRKVPAYLNQQSDGGSRRTEFLISTEKKGGIVFLQVEKTKPVDLKKKKDRNKS